MRNILRIMRHDLRKITGSVVAIITVMGLCIVPCLYAWFNIFSNWSPYESDATGRIAVAVANIDKGAEMTGLEINVGDKIVEALEANDAIGWRFVDSEEQAREGVLSGEYYAAIVLPEDFSRDALSFAGGDLTNPRIRYYENEKKNAIAPKITGKAQTALKEEVDAAFVETLTSYVTSAVSVTEASGTEPSALLSDLSSRVEELSSSIDSCIVLSDSAGGLTDAAGNLMNASGTLIDSTGDVLTANDKVLREAERNLTRSSHANIDAVKAASKSTKRMGASLKPLKDTLLTLAGANSRIFSNYIDRDRDDDLKKVDRMKADADSQAAVVGAAGFTALAGRFTDLSGTLGEISAILAGLSKDMTPEERAAAMSELSYDIDKAIAQTDAIMTQIEKDVDTGIGKALDNTRKSVSGFRKAMASANSDLGDLDSTLGDYRKSLTDLRRGIDDTTAAMKSIQNGSDTAAAVLSNAAGNELLAKLSGVLGSDEAAVAEYLANPIKMDTELRWPIENYGSAMAPFYTVLAQWVGALLTAVLIKVKIKKNGELEKLRLHEWYFGRYGLYLLVGLAQGLIVSLGDLFYVRIQCVAPLRFVLAACINGIVFTMINYALVFALDNIGLGAGVIVLVLQVAGSGGTYPVEVLPQPFRVLYPFMPFRYSMDAMRECIGGMYGDTYLRCIGVLLIFFVFASAFGMAMYRPARRLNEMIAASKAKSEIML